MVFASKDGKVFVYEMVERTLGQVFDLSGCEEEVRKREIKSHKEVKLFSETAYRPERIYSTKMELFPEKKLISTSCEEEYKIVAVVNGRKLFILNYKQMKKNWTNTEK